MSYDISIGKGEWFNYTSNMRQLFVDYDAYPPDLHGKTGRVVAVRLSASIARIAAADTSLLATYDAGNGWGSWTTALKFLMEVRDACRRAPEQIVGVSA